MADENQAACPKGGSVSTSYIAYVQTHPAADS